jgi:hypothetical protein
MHTFANQHFDRFQIGAPGLAAVGKDLRDETLYFAFRFLLDRAELFFPVASGRRARLAAVHRSAH